MLNIYGPTRQLARKYFMELVDLSMELQPGQDEGWWSREPAFLLAMDSKDLGMQLAVVSIY